MEPKLTCIWESLKSEKVISMCVYHNYIIVATDYRVLRIEHADCDEMIKIEQIAVSQLKEN